MRRSVGCLLIVMLALGLDACAPNPAAIVPSAAPVSADVPPRLADSTVQMPDGTLLPIHAWLPKRGDPSSPRAIILAIHGFNDYSHAFAGVAPFLAGAGLAVFAYDQRGFGGAPQTGRWVGASALVADIDNVVRLLGQRYPGRPIYLMGESMGGAETIVEATQPGHAELAGIILVAPAVWGRPTLGLGPRVALWLTSHTVPWLTLTGQGLEIWPTDNIDILQQMSADPRIIKATRIDTLYGLVDLMDLALARAPHLTLPALVLYGDTDQIVPKVALCRLLETLPPRPPGHWRFVYFDHGYHMLLRDIRGPVRWADIFDWVDDRGAQLPFGQELLAHPAGPAEIENTPLCREAD